MMNPRFLATVFAAFSTFALAANIMPDPEAREYLKELAKAGIFWELNVNYDSIHRFREHEYVKEFFKNTAQQKAVREAGLFVSIGFDGHRVEDYDLNRVAKSNRSLYLYQIKNAVKLIRQKRI